MARLFSARQEEDRDSGQEQHNDPDGLGVTLPGSHAAGLHDPAAASRLRPGCLRFRLARVPVIGPTHPRCPCCAPLRGVPDAGRGSSSHVNSPVLDRVQQDEQPPCRHPGMTQRDGTSGLDASHRAHGHAVVQLSNGN